MAAHHAETAGNWVRSNPMTDCITRRRSNHGHIKKSPIPGLSPFSLRKMKIRKIAEMRMKIKEKEEMRKGKHVKRGSREWEGKKGKFVVVFFGGGVGLGD